MSYQQIYNFIIISLSPFSAVTHAKRGNRKSTPEPKRCKILLRGASSGDFVFNPPLRRHKQTRGCTHRRTVKRRRKRTEIETKIK